MVSKMEQSKLLEEQALNYLVRLLKPLQLMKVDSALTGLQLVNSHQQRLHSILSIKDWSTFTVTNNLPYSEVIEFGGYKDGPNTTGGFSKKAPQGVVRVNIMRFNKLLADEAKKNLPK